MIRKQKKEKRDRRKQINKRRGCLKATLAEEDPPPCIPATLAAECGDTLPRVHRGRRRAQAWDLDFGLNTCCSIYAVSLHPQNCLLRKDTFYLNGSDPG